LVALEQDTGKTFAAAMPPSLAQRKPSYLTANDMIGVVWIILRICMMMYMKSCGKQALQKSYMRLCGEIKKTILHPEYLVMVDKVGENISQKGDVNDGGQTFMVVNDMRAQVPNSFKDNNVTVICFIAANGQPTMCSIIIEESKLKMTDVTGYNPLSSDGQDICGEAMKVWGEEIDALKYDHINDADRMFPFGPTCTFNGVKVPTIVTCRKNGSITSQFITNMLSKMNDYCLFDRSNGTSPFLLCDGYGSRSEEPFLEYTLESNMPWNFCIVLPYGTSTWQLGDSVEQNGTLKNESKKANAETAGCKICAGLSATLELSDIVRIMNIAWQK
jgi:hypothetical protein